MRNILKDPSPYENDWLRGLSASATISLCPSDSIPNADFFFNAAFMGLGATATFDYFYQSPVQAFGPKTFIELPSLDQAFIDATDDGEPFDDEQKKVIKSVLDNCCSVINDLLRLSLQEPVTASVHYVVPGMLELSGFTESGLQLSVFAGLTKNCNLGFYFRPGQPMVWHFENIEEPSPEQIEKIAQWLTVTCEQIVGRTPCIRSTESSTLPLHYFYVQRKIARI